MPQLQQEKSPTRDGLAEKTEQFGSCSNFFVSSSLFCKKGGMLPTIYEFTRLLKEDGVEDGEDGEDGEKAMFTVVALPAEKV